tara:strand:- start:948 stop:1916 length:969 start_codon:yes stop_codon:yes gene_type:complete
MSEKPSASKAKTGFDKAVNVPEWHGLFTAEVEVSKGVNQETKDSEKVASIVLEALGVTPELVYKTLSKDMPEDQSFELCIVKKKKENQYDIIASLIGSDGKYSLTSTARIERGCRGGHFVNINTGFSQSSKPGKGLGRMLAFNNMQLLKLIGKSKVRLTAGRQNGAYVWSRFGFLPTDEEQTKQVLGQARARLRSLCQFVSADRAKKLLSFMDGLDVTNPQSLWQLADWGININSLFGNKKEAALDSIMDQYGEEFKTHFMRSENITLGKLLMTQLYKFEAEFDFDNPDQVRRAETYCGQTFDTVARRMTSAHILTGQEQPS